MNIVILGPQGSGKGTQAELLVEKFGLNYLEMGKILRSIAESDNQYAQIVHESIRKGELLADEFVRLIAWDHIQKADKNKGFLFDGYPRSLPQYEHLQDMLRKFGQKFDWVIFLEISSQESIYRLSARRVCGKCGEIFNLITNPPKVENRCDRCNSELTLREDDQPDAIKRRLDLYKQRTEPILKRALEEGVAMEINGEQDIHEIHLEIIKKIQGGEHD